MLNVKDAKYDLGAMGVMAIVGIIIKICFSLFLFVFLYIFINNKYIRF